MKKWEFINGGIKVSAILILIFNVFLWYGVVFNSKVVIIWLIGILLFPLHYVFKVEGSWTLLIIAIFLYIIIAFVIGGLIGDDRLIRFFYWGKRGRKNRGKK